MHVCVCVPVIAVHLPLCADMGCFSVVTQCSFYPVPLAVSPSLSLSSSFSVVTQLRAQSDVSHHLLSNTLALLGEAKLAQPTPHPPASRRLMFTPFSSAPSLHLCHSLCHCHSLCKPSALSYFTIYFTLFIMLLCSNALSFLYRCLFFKF